MAEDKEQFIILEAKPADASKKVCKSNKAIQPSERQVGFQLVFKEPKKSHSNMIKSEVKTNEEKEEVKHEENVLISDSDRY